MHYNVLGGKIPDATWPEFAEITTCRESYSILSHGCGQTFLTKHTNQRDVMIDCDPFGGTKPTVILRRQLRPNGQPEVVHAPFVLRNDSEVETLDGGDAVPCRQ